MPITLKEHKTLGDALDYTWKNSWSRQKSRRTISGRVKKVTNCCGLSFPLRKMTKGHFWTELQNDLQDQYEIVNATVNRHVSIASTAFNFSKINHLHEYRLPDFKTLEEDEARQSWFSKENVSKLAFVATDIFDRPDLAQGIVFSAYTGLRQGEFLKLKPSDIDFATNSIQVGQKKDRNSKGEGRSVPIHKLIVPILESRMDNNYVFGDDWLNKDQLYKQFKKVRKYCGFDFTYVWHSLRHSFCTWACAVDHPRNVMTVAGHKHIETTLRYAHPSDKAAHAMVAKL